MASSLPTLAETATVVAAALGPLSWVYTTRFLVPRRVAALLAVKEAEIEAKRAGMVARGTKADHLEATKKRLATECTEVRVGGRLLPGSYTPVSGMVQALQLRVPIFHGVYIISAPSDTGKTVGMARAIQAARRDARPTDPFPVMGQCVINCADDHGRTLQELLDERFGGLRPEHVLPEGTVLVLDNAQALANEDTQTVKASVLALAQRSVETKVFNVFMLGTCPAFAAMVSSWNGGKKVYRIPHKGVAMTAAESDALLDKLGVARGIDDDELMQHLKDCGHRAQKPGFAVNVTNAWQHMGTRYPAKAADASEAAWAEVNEQ